MFPEPEKSAVPERSLWKRAHHLEPRCLQKKTDLRLSLIHILGWLAILMIVMFSLNKWEMLINGSGWPQFMAFAGFYYHYHVMDRVWAGQELSLIHI